MFYSDDNIDLKVDTDLLVVYDNETIKTSYPILKQLNGFGLNTNMIYMQNNNNFTLNSLSESIILENVTGSIYNIAISPVTTNNSCKNIMAKGIDIGTYIIYYNVFIDWIIRDNKIILDTSSNGIYYIYMVEYDAAGDLCSIINSSLLIREKNMTENISHSFIYSANTDKMLILVIEYNGYIFSQQNCNINHIKL